MFAHIGNAISTETLLYNDRDEADQIDFKSNMLTVIR